MQLHRRHMLRTLDIYVMIMAKKPAHLKKGSTAAKRHMAKLRAMKKKPRTKAKKRAKKR